MFYFVLVITSSTILPTCILPINKFVLILLPALLLSVVFLTVCLTGGEVYALANELTLAISK